LSGTFKFHEGTNARQEPLDFLKVQLDMNLPFPWEEQSSMLYVVPELLHSMKFQVEQEPPESMGDSSLMSNDAQELFNS